MACPSGSAINMLGIARENVYDNYSSTSTPSTPYAISDLVTGGNSGGSGTSFDDKNDIGGYGGPGDPPGNEVAFSHFWGYDHNAAPASAQIQTTGGSDPGASDNYNFGAANGWSYSNTYKVVITGISGNTTIVGSDNSFQLAASNSNPPTNYATATISKSISSSYSTFYFRVKRNITNFMGIDSCVVTVTPAGSGVTTDSITINYEWSFCIHNSIPVNISINETKYIHQLSVGDSILSYNIEEDIIEETEVLGIETPQHDNLYKIIFDDNQELLLTDDHPIFRLDNTLVSIKPDDTARRYKLNTNELVVGDKIRTMNDSKKIISFERYRGEHDTYTIFTKNNNFYADGILAHSEISE